MDGLRDDRRGFLLYQGTFCHRMWIGNYCCPDALDLMECHMTSVTYASILRHCGKTMDVSKGKQVHEHICKSGLDQDIFLGNLVVWMYGSCKALEDAYTVFANMHRHNEFSWAILIGAVVQNGKNGEANHFFRQMQVECKLPDKVTVISMLSACASQSARIEGRRIHACIVGRDFQADLTAGNALVNMYGKCGSLKDALKMFNNMSERDVISWTSVIAACTQHQQGKHALHLFHRMLQEGTLPNRATFVSAVDACASQGSLAAGKRVHIWILSSSFLVDVVLGTAIVNMYGKCGSPDYASRMFEELPKQNAISWTTVIAAFAHNGGCREALQLYQRMQLEGVHPDKISYVSVLDACSSQIGLAEGKQVHAIIVGSGLESDVVIGTSLVHMYGKCGKLEYARMMFDQMPKRHGVSWNALISAYAQHGQGKEVLHMFQQMLLDGVPPDTLTFFIIISACSHAGLVDEGCSIFVSMNLVFGITPMVEHFNCMVDLLGRAGRLDVVEKLIKNMPIRPKLTTWLTMLSACRMHSDVEHGIYAAERILELDEWNASPYILLANIYAATGMLDLALKLRESMKNRGLNDQEPALLC